MTSASQSIAAFVLVVGLTAAPRVGADPWDEPSANDDGPGTLSELAHGSDEQHDLAGGGDAGAGFADEDWFRIGQQPYASYEIVVDAMTGDVVPLQVDRIAANGSSVLQSSVVVGAGSVRSLRWQNASAATLNDQYVRIRSGGCTTACQAKDVYRVRAYETTYAVPRFANSGSQVTVLLLQNPSAVLLSGTVRFWNASGALVGSAPVTLGPKALQVIATQTVAPGVNGTLTIAHNGRYGELAGKAMTLDPTSGFSWETPLVARPH